MLESRPPERYAPTGTSARRWNSTDSSTSSRRRSRQPGLAVVEVGLVLDFPVAPLVHGCLSGS